MASANDTTAPPATAAKVTYLDTLLEKAKQLPTGNMKELDGEVRTMRERAATDPAAANYLDILCRSYLSSEASAARLFAKFEAWQKQQQQEEEEKKKNKEEEEEKKEEERKAEIEGRKRKVEEDNAALGMFSLTLCSHW
jgi:hypothetical protein